MYPTSNVNGQQSVGQPPIYYPANSSQSAYSQGYVNSQVGNQQAPHPSNVNNVRVQQVSDQPLYDPPVYSQSALNQHSQGYVNYSQPCPCQCSVGRPQLTYNGYPQGVPMIRQPMMWSVSGAQYAPVYNGHSARTQPISANLRAQHLPTVSLPSEVLRKELVVDPCSEKKEKPSSVVIKKPTLEELPVKTQEFLKAMDKCLQNKASSSSSETSPSAQIEKELSGKEETSIQKQLEEQITMQKKILELLQLESDYSWKPTTKPKCYTIALDRLKAFKPEEPIAPKVVRKNASMVFIYDIDDITQLSYDILRGVKNMFPDLKNMTTAVEGLFYFMARKFFELNEDLDHDTIDMNVSDGGFGAKINEYMEFKNKIETNGPNIIYELVKAYAEDKKALNINGKPKKDVNMFHAVQFQKLFDEHWQIAKKCLQATSNKSLKNTYENVLLCDMIGIGAVRMLLSGIHSEVPLENLYSNRKATIESVFERIQRDYGDDCQLFLVTSNPKTIAAAEKKNIHVWPIDSAESLSLFHTAQSLLLE